ncbi:MAG: glycosyl hydrolase [Bacteroidetes bacterium]|nr:MAG: glycosyl hydrolase [Bacteroidota bacterium]
MNKLLRFLLLTGLLLTITLPDGLAQRRRKAVAPSLAPPTLSFSDTLYQSLRYRLVGPFRGGRSCTVTGVPGQPNLFYFGATGGGVWRTRDGGSTWENISDGYFGGSIGAVAVAPSDPNVIYVGTGEKTVRGNVSSGNGLWKSVDAGQTWTHIGLTDGRHTGRIRVHPRNPDLVYVAVMGDLFKDSETRGVYRSQDGGATWERVLFANSAAGAVDLIMDPGNPRVLFASTWRIRRTPYSLESGGEGSALWKSVDGGDTWTELTGNGLPKGTLGIIGVTVSPANPRRVWALIEAKEGGLFRSDNGGESWSHINQDRALRQRAWYYTRIYADSKDEEVVYVMNVNYHKSTDGGRTFKAYNAPHGDHHDLWIAPEDPQRMIIGDDGGAQITFDGGENWSTYYNQPTAQFYRVVTDNHFPFRIYGAQQDNSTVRILHRTDGYQIGERDWESTAGGESAHIAIDPEDNDIVYGGSYGGYLTRINHRTGERRAINVWPDNPMGHGAEGMRYRFQWNFPIFFSPHDPNKLYAASNHLHASTNEGQSWELLSPDLTRNDSSKLGPSGGPITKDNTGVEYYCTIFAALESPLEPGLLWTGSDDGLIHLSRDGGENWENVTPPADLLPEWTMINSLEAHPTVKGGLYVAATAYKLGDYRPYLLRTLDYGKSWTRIDAGIEAEHFTRVVRADPAREGLLYAGTEQGMYISFDDGASWKPFQLNLPVVPITDLTLKDGSLVVATQGRSFWIIDDLSPLHQLSDQVMAKASHLFAPATAWRMAGSGHRQPRTAGQNHPGGALIHFYLQNVPADSLSLKLVFMEEDGTPIRTFARDDKENPLGEVKAGTNLFRWNLQYPGAETFDGMILWWAETDGPQALPGTYRVRLVVGTDSMEQTLILKADPRLTASGEDLKAQFDYLIRVRDKLSETHLVIKDLREVRDQLKTFASRIKEDSTYTVLATRADELVKEITTIEEALYQTQNRSGQDPLNFPIRQNNKLAHLAALAGVGQAAPTDQAEAFLAEVSAAIDAELEKWTRIREEAIPAFNAEVRSAAVDAIFLD